MTTLNLLPTDWRTLWGEGAASEGVGAIYTKAAVVEFMLDIAGYVAGDVPLRCTRLLEPSCGDGAFLDCILTRLIASERAHPSSDQWNDADLAGAVRAFDLDMNAVARSWALIQGRLCAAGCDEAAASRLAKTWVRHADFLLETEVAEADLVIGNPPYVRLEHLPKNVLSEYRGRFTTLTDRADLYVAFYERGLELLSESGRLVFITANRFAKNQYGGKLRRLLSDHFHVELFLNLEHTQPFESDVSAYPSIILVDRERGKATRAASLEDIEPTTLKGIQAELRGESATLPSLSAFPEWYPSGEPWLTTSLAEHRFLDAVSECCPLLENSASGTTVGIGVATGADAVFVLRERHPDIEPECQLPLAMAGDVSPNGVAWSGRFLVNPFRTGGQGELVSLSEYPGLASYLERNESRLRGRHVAKARASTWYRTIDRIWPELVGHKKLLIPDIQRGGVVGLDDGHFYPHHNLYWIRSEAWPLSALQAILRSSFGRRQVSATSVQMRGGSLRYQAQSLRRIRVPALASLPSELLLALERVARASEMRLLDDTVREAYLAAGVKSSDLQSAGSI